MGHLIKGDKWYGYSNRTQVHVYNPATINNSINNWKSTLVWKGLEQKLLVMKSSASTCFCLDCKGYCFVRGLVEEIQYFWFVRTSISLRRLMQPTYKLNNHISLLRPSSLKSSYSDEMIIQLICCLHNLLTSDVNILIVEFMYISEGCNLGAFTMLM